ncbi:MAG: response regulator, partial [Phycisphaerae bacterium]|nr:response regulator [Phycisphaerae bacterium]
ICTGFEMPLMGGLELARRLRGTPATEQIPIMMLTARGHRIEMSDLLNTNVRGVVGKPFSAREVLAKLEEVACEFGVVG